MRTKKLSKIQKRNGSIVDFNPQKIVSAISKAGLITKEFNKSTAKALSKLVLDDIKKAIGAGIPSVEYVQDVVENVLIASKYKKTAKAYILYREQHTQMRKIVSVSHVNLIDQYLQKLDWQVNENSNMGFSLQGLNNYISSEISKVYWLNKVYPKEIRKAQTNASFHIHDLSSLSVYCVGWSLDDLLLEGFGGVAGKIECAPPKHFRSALGQIVNFFYTLQGEVAGAEAFSNFDTLLAPFIRYDKLSYKEVKQAMQEFIFNLNVPTRVGFQTPFTNVTMDIMVPEHYRDQSVIIGGKPQNETYKDFQDELDLFNKAFLEVMSEGDATGRVFTFPIPTYNITDDFDWENKNLALLWEVTAKYGIPYFSNYVNSDMKPDDARSMCCRLRIDNRKLEKRGGGLFGASPLTGSIGVVTINLPQIGYLAKNRKEFFAHLSEVMDLAKESLEIKRKILERFTSGNLYPYTSRYLRKIKETFGEYWKNHFSTIGLVGMNEAIMNFMQKDIASKEGKQFAEKVLDFMRDKLVEFQKETGNNYNLEATPAEGTSYRLALADQKHYDDIYFANGKGKEVVDPFYTNSTHLPVNYSEDLFEILDLQDNLQTKYTGGTVVHFFLGEKIEDSTAIRNIVKKICANYKLPYFSITPTFSVCPTHGYLSGEIATCPKCKNSCEIYSRVVGYLRPISHWNKGKHAEFVMRTTVAKEAITGEIPTNIKNKTQVISTAKS
ncbi:ribonucleoside triphosphate reductase [Patescibacteria group bacterium]|nr:ribonucleoside triphosphate reductase [Patescibacteria group bacterium]MBU1519440.1 ribonucleoside triphosphate reductase [Patescibacteria group bacterium]MBU2416379.1 ribonucleoside triphosphate reductase [Patescibacteria group bacterium]MBU2460680.1 ribonucleoside triphosphate reductase [Patescibacteria group bacterium]